MQRVASPAKVFNTSKNFNQFLEEQPLEVQNVFKKLVKYRVGAYSSSFLTTRIIKENDSRYLEDKEREDKLKELFAQADIEVEFVGEYNLEGEVN